MKNDKRGLKTIRLSPEALERRRYWRYYQAYCAKLINLLGLERAKKVIKCDERIKE